MTPSHTITSLRADAGNEMNFDRQLNVEHLANRYFSITIAERIPERESFTVQGSYNISRKAAEELMATLDLFLSETEPDTE